MAKSKEVAVVGGSAFVALSGEQADEFAEVLRENMGGDGVSPADLDRITLPAQGGQYWTVEGEPPTQQLSVVVTAFQPTRSYWELPLDDPSREDGAPPDCSSRDAVHGSGLYGPGSDANPSGLCGDCPMSKYGSGKGNSQACKEQRQVFVLLPDNVMPTRLSLPATAIAPFRKYMFGLANKRKRYYEVVTVVGLDSAKSGGGIVYSVPTFSRGEDLAPEEAARAAAMGELMRKALESADVSDGARPPADAARVGADEVPGEAGEAGDGTTPY